MSTLTIQNGYILNAEPLREARSHLNLSNTEIAESAGITSVHVCRILKGRSAGIKSVKKLCKVLGVSEAEVISTEVPSTLASP